MAAAKFSADELELLTEEEREGLLENVDNEEEADDGEGAEAAAAADEPAAGAKAEELPVVVADDAAAAAAAVEKPAAEVAGTVAAEAAAGVVIEHEDDDALDIAAGPAWRAMPADNATNLVEIDKQLDELAQKFDDGELTGKEYRSQSSVLENQKQDLREEKFKTVLAQEAAVSHWSTIAVPAFLEKHSQYAEPGTFLYSALDAEVRKLQSGADNPFDPKLLAQAHKTIDEQIRKATGQAAAAVTPKPAAAKPAAKREIVPSLAHVPAADINDADSDGSKFAWLDRLADTDALKYEAELGKMSEAEREQYLAN